MDIRGDKTFYTVTMARVHANQGRYEEAARIYRYLLDQSPDRTDLRRALDETLSLMPTSPEKWQEVSDLVAGWVTLLLRYKSLRRLQKNRLTSLNEGV